MLSIVVFFLDFVMGALFFTSFYFKLFAFRDFELSIHSYRVLPLPFIRSFAIGLLLFEFILFIGFASGQAIYYKELSAITFLLIMSFFLWRKSRAEYEVQRSCSCFGSIDFLNRYPLSRNSILIALCTLKCLLLAVPLTAKASFRQFLIHIVVVGSCVLLMDFYQTRKRYKALQVKGW